MSLKILLADDSLTAQNMGKKILTDAGYEVIAVSNGAQAIKKIVSELPDLVVLDVYMPGYSGVELCERIRSTRETAATPVVLSVGKMEPFRPEETMRVRADGLIVKPFEASELLAVVKKLAEKIAAAPPRRKPAPPEEEQPAAPEAAAAEPEPPQVETSSLDIPKEIAATPAIGMDLITEEAAQPDPGSDQRPAPFDFKVEHAPEPSAPEAHDETQMTSTSGLSGVFEVEPSTEPAAAEEPELPAAEEAFERFSAPAEIPAETTTEAVHASAPEPVGEATHGEMSEASEFEHISAAGMPAEPDAQMEAPQPAAEGFQSHAADVSPSYVSSEVPNLEEAPPEQPSDPFAVTPVWDRAPAPEERPVWSAEEVPLEPEDCAIPLHEQVRRLTNDSSEPGASSLEEREQPDFHPVQWESAPATTHALQEPSQNNDQAREYFRPDFSVEEMATLQASWPVATADFETRVEPQPMTAPQPEPAPASAVPEIASMAASAVAPEAAPQITSVAPDPARIAHIVDQVLERLKPELIAAVTRELEKKQ